MPQKHPSTGPGISAASWVFGSILLAFVIAVFVFAPSELPEFKIRILAFSCALLAGLFGFFMTGDIGLRFTSVQTKAGKIVVRATGGLALFVLVLWWWFSSAAPIKQIQQALKEERKLTTAEINKNTDKSAQDVKNTIGQEEAKTRDTVRTESEKTRDTVQDSALATLETMFPLAVRIPAEIDGTIIRINGSEEQRIVSYDKDYAPMKLYWGDLFHYFVYVEGEKKDMPTGTVYLQLGDANHTRLPISLQPWTENQLRIPGHTPRPMEAFIYNPSHLSGFSLKVTVYSADRERGRMRFREAFLKTDLGSYARKSYLTVIQDGARLRSGPSDSSSNVLRIMLKDTYVKILGVNGEWTQIRLPEGREGWVASKFLGPIS